MAKHKISFDDYEEREDRGYDGDEPKKGLYDARLVSVDDHESQSGNEGFQWVFEITDGEYKGWRGWTYSNTDSTMWKTQQIVKAISGQAKDFTLDTEDHGAKTVKKSKALRMRLITEKYEGEPKARIRTLLPAETSKDSDDDPFDD